MSYVHYINPLSIIDMVIYLVFRIFKFMKTLFYIWKHFVRVSLLRCELKRQRVNINIPTDFNILAFYSFRTPRITPPTSCPSSSFCPRAAERFIFFAVFACIHWIDELRLKWVQKVNKRALASLRFGSFE